MMALCLLKSPAAGLCKGEICSSGLTTLQYKLLSVNTFIQCISGIRCLLGF